MILYEHESPDGSRIQVVQEEGVLSICIVDAQTDTAAAVVTDAAGLAQALMPVPAPVSIPDSLPPAGHAIAAHFVAGFTALRELAKTQPGAVDLILRSHIKTIENWRSHVLKEIAA